METKSLMTRQVRSLLEAPGNFEKMSLLKLSPTLPKHIFRSIFPLYSLGPQEPLLLHQSSSEGARMASFQAGVWWSSFKACLGPVLGSKRCPASVPDDLTKARHTSFLCFICDPMLEDGYRSDDPSPWGKTSSRSSSVPGSGHRVELPERRK